MKLCISMLAALMFFLACSPAETPPDKKEEQDYIFFLHNRFLELSDLAAKHPEYGRAEYKEILDAFRKEKFVVLSEKRTADTDMQLYAKKIAAQVDSLLKTGVKPQHITVIGTSKGGYIAQYVSTYLANPDLNFVFVACFQDSDITEHPEINFCGNILTIYEKTDPYGVSAIKRKETSKLPIKQFKQIELNTGLNHGFLYKPMKEWIRPCSLWARQNYDLTETNSQ